MSTDTGAVSVRVQPGRKNHVGHGILIGTIYRGQQMFPVKKKKKKKKTDCKCFWLCGSKVLCNKLFNCVVQYKAAVGSF